MPGPFHQWLYFHNGDYLQEVVNGARTATYLQSVGLDGISICSVLDMAGCPAYGYIPCEEDSSGNPVPEFYDCDADTLIEFTTPSLDPAPWYTADVPVSEDALGFYIEEWTGLDSAHMSRPSSAVGRVGGSVTFGAAGSPGRVQKINILLLARSEEAMAYLFDWLDATLIGACNGCAADSLLYRRACPDPNGPDMIGAALVGEQRRVVLTEGLRWEADVEGRGTCQIRRASFTLTAGDPCVYGRGDEPSVTSDLSDVEDCVTNTTWDPGRSQCRPTCAEVDATCASTVLIDPPGGTGWMWAPVIRLDNDSATPALPIRLVAYSPPSGYDGDSWCGLPVLGEIYIQPLPAYSRLTWDVVGRRILYSDITTGVDVETYAYVEANDPPIQRWFTASCHTPILVVVEPADFCMEEDGGELTWERGGLTFTDPHYPDLDIHINQRHHCP